MAEDMKDFFDSIKFPPGISYCEWEKLDHQEKDILWKKYNLSQDMHGCLR